MGAFTIYNCGTSYDERNNELIADLYKATSGERAKNKLICAGPGSKLASRPGYDPKLDPDKYPSPSNLEDLVYQGAGIALGMVSALDQVNYNVRRVLKILGDLNPKPGLVNMAGWSRGACTCHAIANAMKRDPNSWINSVPVNIFAFDPVPGTGHEKNKDWNTVPWNVANYEVIFMENEHRVYMDASNLIIESSGTKRRLLHMPGKHWFAVERDKEVKKGKFESVFHVAADLAVEFLEHWGTKFDDRTMLRTDPELLEDYASMIKLTQKFFENGGDKPYRLTGNHQATFKVQNHLLSSSPYFVNVHHKEVFRRVAPNVFKYFFVHQIFDETHPYTGYVNEAVNELQDEPWVIDRIMTELATLMSTAPETYETLSEFARFVEKPRAKVLQMPKVVQMQSVPKPGKPVNSIASFFRKLKVA